MRARSSEGALLAATPRLRDSPPCPQFGGQEPENDEKIAEFCELNHGVTFPLMAKSDVNGDNTNEVYKWLKAQKSGLLGLTRIKVRSLHALGRTSLLLHPPVFPFILCPLLLALQIVRSKCRRNADNSLNL